MTGGAPELAVAVVGAALIGGAIAWRATTRRGARAAIRAALCSPSRASRLAALQIIAAEGVAAYSGLLRQRAGVEMDPEVRRTLAEVIARSQWEPAADEALVELRLWAHRQLSAPVGSDPVLFDVSELQAPDAPALGPAPVRTVAETPVLGPAPPATDPVPGETRARPPEPSWWHLAPLEPEPTVVLVTGTGGPAGVAVVRWLRAAGHRVVATDADDRAVGLRLGDESAVLRRHDDPRYVESVCEVASRTGAEVIVPTIAEELLALSAGTSALEAVSLRAWLPEPDAVMNCIDKWRFSKVALGSGATVPATNLGSGDDVPGPWVVKPRFGRGSRDVVTADGQASLAVALASVPDPIVQSLVPGREFTVDVLVGPDGQLAGAVPRWRLETRGGISTRGETFVDPGLFLDVALLLEALGLRGAANVQGFLGEDGTACFIEVNPRFSGGLPLTLAAGADLVGEYVRVARGLPVRPERCRFRQGVLMMRFFEDVFEG